MSNQSTSRLAALSAFLLLSGTGMEQGTESLPIPVAQALPEPRLKHS
jgi:hypothetical protein